MMTETGSFVINGTERVVVSQMHQSQVYHLFMTKEKHTSGKLLLAESSHRGAWLDFDLFKICSIRIDRRKLL